MNGRGVYNAVYTYYLKRREYDPSAFAQNNDLLFEKLMVLTDSHQLITRCLDNSLQLMVSMITSKARKKESGCAS